MRYRSLSFTALVLILFVPVCRLADAGDRPQADVLTNVSVNVDTEIEVGDGGQKVVERVEKIDTEEEDSDLEGLAVLLSLLQGNRGEAPVQVITNVQINVRTKIRLDRGPQSDTEEGSQILPRRNRTTTVEEAADPRKASETEKLDEQRYESTETDDPGHDELKEVEDLSERSANETSDVRKKQGAERRQRSDFTKVELKLNRISIGETIDLEVTGQFPTESEASDMAARINREKLKWSGRLVALPFVLKTDHDSLKTVGKFVAGLEAQADGDQLKVSASIPREIVSAVKDLSRAGLEKFLAE